MHRQLPALYRAWFPGAWSVRVDVTCAEAILFAI
jgi:hypothetical protein